MMIFDEVTDSLLEQKPHSLSISNDTLLSLLQRPPPSSPCSDMMLLHSGGCYLLQELPPSFNEPFDDPDMEPLPLGSNSARPDLVCESLYPLLSSVNPWDEDTPPPAFGGGGSKKRGLDDLFSAESRLFHSKRQRGPLPATSDETVMRFRPYQEKQWKAMFQKLVLYKHKHGHCSVPHSYQEDPMLARWVKRQRYQRKKFEDNDSTSTMTSHRIYQLDSIGFVWQSHSSAWHTKLNELKSFKHRAGHCNVPSNYTENIPLATWVRSQRRQYQMWLGGSQSTMTIQRHELLVSLGFSFESPKSTKKQTI